MRALNQDANRLLTSLIKINLEFCNPARWDLKTSCSLSLTRELPRDHGHEIGQIENHAAYVLNLYVLVLHEHTGHPRAGGNSASPGFERKERFLALRHLALHPQYWLAASVKTDEVAGRTAPLSELRNRVLQF